MIPDPRSTSQELAAAAAGAAPPHQRPLHFHRSEEELTRVEAAAIARVTTGTFSGYVTRGQAPAPVRRIGRTPLWSRAEIEQWMRDRPGAGSRNTRRAERRAIVRRQIAMEAARTRRTRLWG